MGYANPIERMGLGTFVAAARDAGVDGVLIVDYPPEESADWLRALEGSGIDPDLPALAHLQRGAHRARGAGGEGLHLLRVAQGRDGRVEHRYLATSRRCSRASASAPSAGRRGLRHPRRRHGARAWRQVADAVVIGTRIVQEIAEGPVEAAPERARRLIAEFRGAMDGGPRSLPAVAGVEDDAA